MERWMRAFCGLFVVLHVVLLSRWYSGDALYYVLAFQKPDWHSSNFMLPQHPLWNVLGTWLYQGYSALGYGGGPLELIQIVNTLVGAVALWQFYRLLRDLECDDPLAFWLTAWLGVSYCFWFYASDVKMYAWVSLLVFVVLRLALQASDEWRPRALVLLGICSTLLMLFHVTSYYLTPVVLTLLVMKPGPRFGRVALAGGVFVGTLLLGYFLAYLPVMGHGQGTFWEWLTSPARAAYPGLLHQQPFLENFAFFTKRFRDSITGTSWYPAPRSAYSELGWAISIAYPYLFFGFFLVVPTLGRVAASVQARALVLLWLFCSLAGFVLATPDSDYVFGLLAPMLALMGVGIGKPAHPRLVRTVAAAVVVLFAVNLAMRWLPAAVPRNNPQLARALDAQQVVPAGALLVSLRDSSYYAYFDRCDTLDLYLVFQQFWNHPAVTPLEFVGQELDRALAAGRPVYLNDDVFSEPYDFFIMPKGLGFDKDVITRWFSEHYAVGPAQGSHLFRVRRLTPR